MGGKNYFRIHPTINFARFGTSEEYYLSPETSAGLPLEGTETTGGLPVKKGTESDFISSSDLRDSKGYLKRQAARFRIFTYNGEGQDSYPNGGGEEIVKGTKLADGRVVKDIIWTVHLANKKAAAYNVVNSAGIGAYKNGEVPQLRNPATVGPVDRPARLKKLMIDPGPRAIAASEGITAVFDSQSVASYCDAEGNINTQPNYPKSFPSDSYDKLFEPTDPLNSLGEMCTDEKGRLLVLTSYGRTAAVYDEYGVPIPLTGDLNNVGWYDDAADGPVSATLVFEDGSVEDTFGAWVMCGDPAYAPQIRNVVSVWDDVYDTWIRNLKLQPEIYKNSQFREDYKPPFETMVRPIFRAATMQRWTANLPEMAVKAHNAVDAITAEDDPNKTIMAGLNYIRNPNVEKETNVGIPLMPLSLGQAGQAFLAVSKTQYFFLEQWSKHKYESGEGAALGPGEKLDIASLSNCLGGRYVPGIEMSYVIRSPEIYISDWRSSGAGPFRVKHQTLHYAKVKPDVPFLSGGWIPAHNMTDGLQPGDLSKFMAIPWQTDYNSCSIHQTSINTAGVNTSTGNETTLFWSWPSQRPDAVYVAQEVISNVLPAQKWSIRGKGTYAQDPKTKCTFQDPVQAVKDWDCIGIVLQGTAIEGGNYSPEFYLEVESDLTAPGTSDDPVPKWPFNATPSSKRRKR